MEISQYIKIGDLTALDEPVPFLAQLDINPTLPADNSSSLPSFSLNDLDGYSDMEPRLSDDQEDALLKVTMVGSDIAIDLNSQ